MATVQVYTAERMLAIEQASVVDGNVVGDNLILTTQGGTPIDAGDVRGPTGATGATGDTGLSAAFVVKAASTANLTLSGTQTIDGVIGTVGDRILAKDQTLPANNGVWVMASGAWTRPTDVDSAFEVAGAMVRVTNGTTNGGTRWITTFKGSDTLTVTAMNWYRATDGSNIVHFTTGGTTNASGLVTITHGLPWTPSQVLHCNGNPQSSFAVLWGVDTIGSTTFQARFMNGSTAGALNALSIGVARWTAFR